MECSPTPTPLTHRAWYKHDLPLVEINVLASLLHKLFFLKLLFKTRVEPAAQTLIVAFMYLCLRFRRAQRLKQLFQSGTYIRGAASMHCSLISLWENVLCTYHKYIFKAVRWPGCVSFTYIIYTHSCLSAMTAAVSIHLPDWSISSESLIRCWPFIHLCTSSNSAPCVHVRTSSSHQDCKLLS